MLPFIRWANQYFYAYYVPRTLLGTRDEKQNKTETSYRVGIINTVETVNKLAIIVWPQKFYGSTWNEYQTQIWGFRLEAKSVISGMNGSSSCEGEGWGKLKSMSKFPELKGWVQLETKMQKEEYAKEMRIRFWRHRKRGYNFWWHWWQKDTKPGIQSGRLINARKTSVLFVKSAVCWKTEQRK